VDEDFLRRVREKAAAKIEALPRDLSFEESESALAAIEASLVRAALNGKPPEQQSLVESRVSTALGDVTGVSSHVVDRMRRALTRREVRLLLGLPALTLLHG
jgi:outer membrane protein assembly factor BamE (lipoprotein component of BamABCDE complex)